VVGLEVCDACVCDVNADGQLTVVDPLMILRKAVGHDLELRCAAASTMTVETPREQSGGRSP
jgi:hypothetical protein